MVIDRQVVQAVGQGIDQRALMMTVPWMHHHTCRLVNHQQGFVFVNNVQGNVLCNQPFDPGWMRQDQLNRVQGLDLVAGLDGQTIHQQRTGLDSVLNAVA